MGHESDPIAGLEGKLTEFAATLSADELAVLTEMVQRAAAVEPEVAGLTMKRVSADPCEGGEVFDPQVFDMLHRLSIKLRR